MSAYEKVGWVMCVACFIMGAALGSSIGYHRGKMANAKPSKPVPVVDLGPGHVHRWGKWSSPWSAGYIQVQDRDCEDCDLKEAAFVQPAKDLHD